MPIQFSEEIHHRDRFADLCNARGLLHNAVEVGTDKAAFANQFLNVWRGDRLVCVDPWRPLEDYEDVLIHGDRSADFAIAMAALARHNWRVYPIRDTSEAAARIVQFPVDFVYIDGNHAYEHVARDMDLWWPKLQPGGILAGHDYDEELPGVMRAVEAFARRERVMIYLTHEPRFRSWYVYKTPTEPVRLLENATRVFVTGTGRCGSVSFAEACGPIQNYSVAHEQINRDLDYPDHHIAVNPQFRGILPVLARKYPGAKWVHLVRKGPECIASLARLNRGRWIEAWRSLCNGVMPEDHAEAARRFYHAAVPAINAQLKALPEVTDWRVMRLENIQRDWRGFWDWIGAEGDFDSSLRAWSVPKNMAKQRGEL